MKNYGEYFKALRESKGLTLRDVEKKADVSNAYLSQLESGKIKQPSPVILHKLALFYNVAYEVLMEKVGYPVPRSGSSTSKRRRDSSYSQKLGEIPHDEEIELLQYLKFIRNRKL